MITYQITRFVHSIIRDNKLIHTVDALVEQSQGSEALLDDLIVQFKRFLAKNDEEIFEEHRLKYMTYLGDFREHMSEIKELQDKKTTEADLILLELYELPKKRNNLLSTVLVYFYLRNHSRLHGRIIFQIIHLYFLIISYRNRLDEVTRRNIGQMDQKQYYSLETQIEQTWTRTKRKHPILTSSAVRMMGSFVLLAIIGFFSWNSAPVTSMLRADVNGVGSTATIGKVAMDSLLLGRLSDGVNASIQSFGLQNILMIALFAVIFQSLRTGFTNLFVNSLLTKTFDFFGTTLKFLGRAIFAIYNYIIYKVATRFMFSCVEFCIARNIRPGTILFGIFSLAYFSIYLTIIAAYLVLGALLFAWTPAVWQIGGVAAVLSILLIYANFHSDVTNFREFMLTIERTLKGLADAKAEKEKAKA